MPETPVADDSDVAMARCVARIARQLEKALANEGLTLTQYRLLAMLSRGHAAASKLADALKVSRPNLTAQVDNLVSRGLVERQRDPADRRRVTHQLTDDGAAVLARADDTAASQLRAILSSLPEREVNRVRRGLLLLSEALDRFVAKMREGRPADLRPRTPTR